MGALLAMGCIPTRSFATPSITGLEKDVLYGVNHAGDAVTQQGKLDLGTAFTDAGGRAPTATFPPITLNPGAALTGRALAQTGAVTMDNNTIQIPEAGSTLLLGAGLVTLLARSRRIP